MVRSVLLTLLAGLILVGPTLSQNPAAPSVPRSFSGAESSAHALETVRLLCVDSLVGDPALAGPARELVIAELFAVKRFVVTEKCEKAQAIVKGAVLQREERKTRAEGEGTDFGVAAGGANVGPLGGSAGFGAIKGGGSESLYSAETRRSASVALRIVDQDGTVLWAYTQDSQGGKTKAALPDAVDRAMKQLQRDIQRYVSKPAVAGPRNESK